MSRVSKSGVEQSLERIAEVIEGVVIVAEANSLTECIVRGSNDDWRIIMNAVRHAGPFDQSEREEIRRHIESILDYNISTSPHRIGIAANAIVNYLAVRKPFHNVEYATRGEQEDDQ